MDGQRTPVLPKKIFWGILLSTMISCVGCDQFSKRLAQDQLKGHPPRSYVGDLFRLQYAENSGAFLGLGGELPPQARWAALVGFNLLITAGVALALAVARLDAASRLGLALLLSGAVGNLIDRLRCEGLVIDFMNVGLGPLRTGIFNVADMAILSGALLLAVPLVLPRAASHDAI